MARKAESFEERLLSLVRELPPERVTEVLDFAEFLYVREQTQPQDVETALQESFGVWHGREDLSGDSAALIRAMRDEWREREERLGLE